MNQQHVVREFKRQVELETMKLEMECFPGRAKGRDGLHAEDINLSYSTNIYNFIWHEVMGREEMEIVWNDGYKVGGWLFVEYEQLFSEKAATTL